MMDDAATREYLVELNRLLYDVRAARQRLASTPVLPAGRPELASAVRAFVTATGGITTLLWPAPDAGKRGARRGAHLRELLGVEDDSPLRARKLRNHLVHFDERLDRILLTRPGRRIYSSVIASSREALEQSPVDEKDIVFRYEAAANEVVIFGDRFRLNDLWQACERIASRVEELRPRRAPEFD